MKLMKKSPVSTFTSVMFALFTFFIFATIPVMAEEPEEAEEKEKEEEEEMVNTFDHTDEQLINFFDANQEMSQMQKVHQKEMSEVVQQEGLTLQRFQQIANANKIGALQSGAFSDEEIEAFNNLGPKISAIQKKIRAGNSEIIQKKGFSSPMDYQAILNDYRRNEELRTYVNYLLRERRKQEILEERRREAEEKMKQQQEAEAQEEGA